MSSEEAVTRPIAVEIANISKKYRISSVNARKTSSKEFLNNLLMRPFNRFKAAIRGRALDTDVDFWPLKDVSFNIYKGETVGIIGPNGSGKSTLLRIIANITSPTKGYVRTRGRVATLLEIGSGFNPELTGRDNILVNAVVLGMSEAEVRRKFDSILDFAEIHSFIDTPIKRYSSGMMVRLAFSVAVHLQPEILIIDEVLAVGDIAFIQKSFAKVKEIAHSGTTVILVSHMAGFITELCNRAIWLDKGQIVEQGDVHTVAANYLKAMLPPPELPAPVVREYPLPDDVIEEITPDIAEEVMPNIVEEVTPDIVEEVTLGMKAALLDTVRSQMTSRYKNAAFVILNQDNQVVTVTDPEQILTDRTTSVKVGEVFSSIIPDTPVATILATTTAERRVTKARVTAFSKSFFAIAHPLYEQGLDAEGELLGALIAFFPEVRCVEIPIDTKKRLQIRKAEIIAGGETDTQADVLVRFSYDVRASLPNYMFGLDVFNMAGVDVFYTNDDYLALPSKRNIGTHVMTVTIPARLFAVGYYRMSFGFWCPETRHVEDIVSNSLVFVISEHIGRLEKSGIEWPSVLNMPDQWTQNEDTPTTEPVDLIHP